MALTKVSRGLLNTSIVDNGNATAITIDSSENVTFSGTATMGGLEIATSTSDIGVDLKLDGNKTSNGAIGSIIFENNGDSVGMIRSNRASANDAADMLFYTQATGGANTQRMAITKDGAVLVGTTQNNPTSSGVNVAGQEFSTTGGVRSTVASNASATFNRKTDDGPVILVRKDGETKGSVATISDDLTIFSTTASHVGLRFGNTRLQPTDNAGATTDGASDLGFSNSRFKEGFFSSDLNIINPSEDERGLSITDQQDGGQNLKFLYNASSNVGRVINDNVDELRFNGAQGAMINTPSFSAISASDQTTVTNSTAQKINFNTQISDTAGGHYATSSSRFTAPHDGTYFFSANISYKGGDGVDDTMYVSYYINGTDSLNRRFVDNWRASSGTGIERVGTYTMLLPLSENDYVELFYAGTAYAITMIGRYTKFSGFAVSLT